MAFVLEHPSSNLKHFCKICKKGFGCGRALGGHMRAHGIGDENGHIDDEDPASDWDDKQLGGNVNPPSNKRMYALRTNPNRLKTCRVCENCGKEFFSWKSFLEHGKCSSEDAESLVSSPGSEGDNDGTGSRSRGCSAWSKRKRSFRAKVENLINSNCPSSEEEDLANCLMMLSNAGVDPMVAEPEESCASASKEDQERRNPMNLMAPLSLKVPVDHRHMNSKNKGMAKGLFECKACKKVFNSHQALGGHRASHKKVKGCFASRIDNGLHLDDSHEADDDVITHEEILPTQSNSTLQFDQVSNPPSMAAPTSKRKSKVHECSICHRIFSSGQALGGHKRCHWITSNAPETSTTLPKFQQQQDQMDQQQIINSKPKLDDDDSALLDLKLDLNLPAGPVNDHHHDRLSGSRRDVKTIKPQGIEVSTEIYLQSWIGTAKEKEDNQQHKQHNLHHRQNADNDIDNIDNNNNNIHGIISNGSVLLPNMDDEADSKVKLAKLSELKDMNTSGGSSPWLQVGIGSTTDVAADP